VTTFYSPGFLTPSEGRVRPGEPVVLCRGEIQTDSSQVASWDYSADIGVQRDIDVDLTGLLHDTGLGPGSRVVGLLTWSSTATRLRGAGHTVLLTRGSNSLKLDLRGDQLGGVLTVDTRLVLERAGHPLPLSPHRPGSTLWSDATRIQLEGGGARFPTIPLPFSLNGIAGGRPGAWALEVRTGDLTASARSALSLFINTEHDIMQLLLTRPDDPRAAQTAEFIRYDVTRQLLARALAEDDLDENGPHEPGSVGEVLATVAQRVFPNRTLDELRAQTRIAPGELEAELQAVLRLLLPESP